MNKLSVEEEIDIYIVYRTGSDVLTALRDVDHRHHLYSGRN
jgi:hypothetical protein